MSIIHVEHDFAIIDEQKFHNEIFKKFGLKMRAELFEINSKFMPDSQFEAIKKRGFGEKKRKRKAPEASEDVTWIQKIAKRIQKAGEEKGYFQKAQQPDNNKMAREFAKKALSTQQLPQAMTSSEQILEISENSEKIDNLLCNGMISNWIHCPGTSSRIMEDSEGVKFHVPPGATFHVGDVTDVEEYARFHDIRFDLIIADPPWFSQSVKRKKAYEMNESVLDRLDIPSIASSDALIVFWITNRKGIEEEMEERLEKWDMEVIGKWKWLKVTMEGEPVGEFDKEKHKVPFESLVLARRKGEAERKDQLPEKFVFASIPMSVHSHKPPLLDLLCHFNVQFSQPLELFSRCLLPNCHSVGYEPFLLQSEHVFEKILP